eukprot:gnl/Carplike_NY0171/31513_a81132_50.p1 GENE.gnl/Carplike_NY0171/31513_a81132_50~~gnl/Carplike_NY0171/31513_a81132_50.p1  ORF type:complete len:125 (-),score=10.92 gnl/Carplike_NY0171/31513_a81132_50:30-404(-)
MGEVARIGLPLHQSLSLAFLFMLFVTFLPGFVTSFDVLKGSIDNIRVITRDGNTFASTFMNELWFSLEDLGTRTRTYIRDYIDLRNIQKDKLSRDLKSVIVSKILLSKKQKTKRNLGDKEGKRM